MPSVEPYVFGAPLWGRSFTQAVDRLMTERFGVESLVLMETAGRGVAEVALENGARERPILVLAGYGNNGGDALVAARWLAEEGCEVNVLLVAPKPGAKQSPAMQAQLKTVKAMGLEVTPFSKAACAEFQFAGPIVIDGLLGLGFQSQLAAGPVRECLEAVGAMADRFVIAVDVPSGLDADSGENQDVPLAADATVTFGALKPAHVLAPARDACGQVVALDIGFLGAAVEEAAIEHPHGIFLADADEILKLDPWSGLKPSAHKYDRGHVLVIGGSPGKIGAPQLAAIAALRAGAGWATIALPPAARDSAPTEARPELTFEDLFDGHRVDPGRLWAFLTERRVRAVVVGPGFMESPVDAGLASTLARFSRELSGFVVFDAGATTGLLSTLAAANVTGDPDRWIATPHPGEWQHLAGSGKPPAEPLTGEGLASARAAARAAGLTLMHKGATPLLVTGDDETPAFVTNEGTNTLGRAGTGDVLAGVIGAHGAMGLPAIAAGTRGMVVVARAAAAASEELGWNSVLAGDIIDRLGTITAVEEEEEE